MHSALASLGMVYAVSYLRCVERLGLMARMRRLRVSTLRLSKNSEPSHIKHGWSCWYLAATGNRAFELTIQVDITKDDSSSATQIRDAFKGMS